MCQSSTTASSGKAASRRWCARAARPPYRGNPPCSFQSSTTALSGKAVVCQSSTTALSGKAALLVPEQYDRLIGGSRLKAVVCQSSTTAPLSEKAALLVPKQHGRLIGGNPPYSFHAMSAISQPRQANFDHPYTGVPPCSGGIIGGPLLQLDYIFFHFSLRPIRYIYIYILYIQSSGRMGKTKL